MLMNVLCTKVILPGFLFPLLIIASSTIKDGNLNTTRLSLTTAKKVESVIINGTHVEVTTVKIAEISNHTNTTTILKAITAKHFTITAPMTTTEKFILIPPANHAAQIKGHHNKLKNV